MNAESRQRGKSSGSVGSPVAAGENLASPIQRVEVVSRNGSNVSKRIEQQSQLEEAEATSHYRVRARKKAELRRRPEEAELAQRRRPKETELELEEEQVHLLGRLE